MAAVTTVNGNLVQVTYTNTTDDDWNHSTDAGFAQGFKVRAIQWLPGAGNDILIVTDGSNSGPAIVHWKASAATDTKQIIFGSPGVSCKPYIDYGNGTYAGAAAQKIIFVLD